MSKQYLENTILPYFFRHQIYIKMFHFQTNKYAGHKASDFYLKKFRENMDRFVETMQGVVGQVNNDNMDMAPFNFGEYRTAPKMIMKMGEFVRSLNNFDLNGEVGLMTIRDEMVADAQQFMYLLKFE